MPFASRSVSRRSFLRVGSLALGGLGLSDLYRLRAASGTAVRDTSVILLWLEGGASHLETYDLKPNAPAEVRGEFKPISTVVPGIDVCEHLPLHAKVAHQFTLIRSLAHKIPDHPGAAGRVLTGHHPLNISDPVSKFPTIEAVVAKVRGERDTGVPPYVSNVPRLKGGGTAYLGQSCSPFVVSGDPSEPNFQVDNLSLDADLAERLDDRVALLNAVDSFRRTADRSGARGSDRFHQAALGMLTSGRTRRAFDLNREPIAVRDRYGKNVWGQSTLMARRLVEAGCSFVTVQLAGQSKKNALVTWDDHGDVGHIFNNMRYRLPLLDRSVSALIEDIYARGLDRRVLVLVATEFGRTPVVNMGRAAKPVHPGRDHWPRAMSALIAGGGFRMGQVIGSTNARGEEPRTLPLDPNDLLASVYQFLGIDLATQFADATGRHIPILPHGVPIAELG
ncbi:MAG: DUF1501 domain-containing protein [Planctomycetes bacterium]|nr:DUF1501 domain-containing protein [Planctomycetota bacterium]